MSYVSIFNDEDNRYYRVNFDVKNSILANSNTSTNETCLLITTTMRTGLGAAFPTFLVRTLSDVPPGETPPATDFTDLCKMYINYFLEQSTIGFSSSSSSSSSSKSVSSSSSKSVSSSSSSKSVSSDSSVSSGSSLSSLSSDH
jgi:hypothetical protein